MKTKSRKYMEGAEFILRQAVFAFAEGCRESMLWLQNFRNECRAGWAELFKKKPAFQEQLNLGFMRKIAEWANWTPEENIDLFTHKIGG